MSSGYIAEVAKKGFGEGTNELYDKARPSYSHHVISYIRECISNPEPFTIVEIGSGTGLFTRSLLSHGSFSTFVKELKAVEPSAGMRNFFVKSTVETDPGKRVSVQDGTFDNTGIENGVADMIVMAQAFHWCADAIHEATAKEFARILKPGGIVVMVWNREDADTAAWVAQIRDFVDSHAAEDQMTSRSGRWKSFFTTPTYSELFEPPIDKEGWPFALPATQELAVERAMSKSPLAVQDDEGKKKAEEALKKILQRGDGMQWIDEGTGVFEYPYKTEVVVVKQKQRAS